MNITNNPLISVIIPVYNRENHIKKCLETITNQSYKNLEIIVVNDGSTDSSMSIAKQYIDLIKIIDHPKNQGLSAARNTGIDNATGEYIHFMDDDDEVNLEFYEKLLKASVETDADMACCSFINQQLLSKSQIITKKKVYTSIKGKYTATYVGKNGYCWRYLFKTSFLRKNNLRFEVGRLIEDLPFSFAAVFYANKIVTVPNTEYIYVYTPNSIINSIDEEKIKKLKKDYKHSKDFIFNFAKKNGNFKIPGVNTGKVQYFLKKVKLGLKLSLKHSSFKYLKF